MIAAFQVVGTQHPHEMIVAVPVAPPDRLEQIRLRCDQVICLLSPEWFRAIRQFYEEFEQVDDARVVELLREFAPASESAS